MPRTILVHLNVSVPDGDDRTAEQIQTAVMGAYEVGSDDVSLEGLEVTSPLAEEV